MQARIARLCDVSAATVTAWFTMSEKVTGISRSHAELICREFDLSISPLWLAEGKGPRETTGADHRTNVIALHPEDALPEDVVQIEEYKVHFSGGNGNTVVTYELEEDSEPATYRLSWLQKHRLSVKHLKRFKVRGESMEPMLFDEDSILVNLAEGEFEQIKDGKVYAFRYGDELRVKRLYRRLDGGLTLRSYNSEYKDEDLTPSQVAQHITLIGRVRDKSGAGGL
ncbi:S24 family peptidase [Diaphorobacter caeni]|uniref:S24 family peptidase n=1 Tax=Diaphorobacter caeni TaxID=2784387 RepID=UPI00188FBEB8|nr:helix-turn-helix transcriptional regulator [Diaphorobacter caeni]MBF5007619.1 helix-turn-helix transcriptional regulator [Diaphorobacter caeni]